MESAVANDIEFLINRSFSAGNYDTDDYDTDDTAVEIQLIA